MRTRSIVIAGLLLAASWMPLERLTAATAEQIKAAESALKQAQNQEKAAYDEWNSREMARSATREIAAAERTKRDKAHRARQSAEQVVAEVARDLKAAEDACAAEKDAAKAKALQEAIAAMRADLASAQQFVVQKEAAVKRAEEEFAKEQALYEQSQANLDVVERKLAQHILATHDAVVAVHRSRYEAAQGEAASAGKAKAAAQEALKSCTPDQKAAAEKACAEKTQAAAAATGRCDAAHRALAEAELVAQLEKQAWAMMERDRLARSVQQLNGKIAALGQQAAKEKDAAKKQGIESQLAAARTELEQARLGLASAEATIQQGQTQRASAIARLQGGLEPLPAEEWNYAKARHLLVRAGFGGTPQEVQKLCDMGLHAAVDHLVDYAFQPAPQAPFDALAPQKPDVLAAYVGKVRIPGAGGRVGTRRLDEQAQFGALRLWWIQRLVESPRPLQEKMTLFWHGHFASQFSVVKHAYNMYQQNQLFREHATGNFGALLYGIVHDPAMLRYLDNNQNLKGKPNENLGREILELFAMGVDQGYTEKDIIQAARALTGYNYDHFSGEFRFIREQHDNGDKTIFGKTGPWSGDDLVTLILEQPATSRFIARKLFAFFASAEPSSETVERLASVLRANQYDVAPMLKNLFASREFYSSAVMGTQIKCPVQLVVGTLRDLGVSQLSDYRTLDAAMREMGQELFEPPDVKGWRYGREWISASRVLVRYNRVAELVRTAPLAGNRRGVDVAAIIERAGCNEAAQMVDHLALTCMNAPLPAAKRQELINFLGDLPPRQAWASQRDLANAKLQNALILMLSTPEFQMN